MPTASERAETLTSLLSNTEQGPGNCGHRFMTDLLVWSLMADGGLEMALYEALRVEIAELAEADETFEMLTCNTAIPLLHLIKQLLRNISFVTHAKLQEFRSGGKISGQKHPNSPSTSLLQRFQRLLIMKIFSKDSNCALAAESLLKKYLYQLSGHVTQTLNMAYEIAAGSVVPQVMQILKEDVTVVLLPEMIVSLIMLEQEVEQFLVTMDWLRVFDSMLKAMDKVNRLVPDVEVFDVDDMAWPGMSTPQSSVFPHKNYDDLPLIKRADIENHNMDGGLWIIISNKVYDVQDFRCDNSQIMETLQKYAGKDATHLFSNISNGQSLLNSLSTCIVGYYCQPEINPSHTPINYVEVKSILMDTERYLGFLCGLHAHSMCKSLPLQHVEVVSKNWLHASFLRGGLQVSAFLVRVFVLMQLN